jgi:hypothetical protein
MAKKGNRTNMSVKQNLELNEKLELGVTVARVCEECRHLDLTDIQQYWILSPPN